MKELSKIREGRRVALPSEPTLYYIRGKAKNGRVHLMAFFRDDLSLRYGGERYSHADKYFSKYEKVITL